MPAEPKMIDMTPKWEGLIPVLIELLQKPAGHEGRIIAEQEITRMAQAADAYIASQKAQKISG